MNPSKTIVALTFTALALAVISTTADSRNSGVTNDQIIASFERDFNHQAAPSASVTRAAIDSDQLYELVNTPIQSPEGVARGEL